MMLHLQYSFDAIRLGGFGVRVGDDGGSFTCALPDAEYAHSDVTAAVDHRGDSPARLASIEVLADALETALNAQTSGAGTYTVTYDDDTFYTVAYDNGNFTLQFSSFPGTEALGRAMGFPGALQSGAASYSSTLRPYYLLIPASMGRTGLKADHYDTSISTDARTDGGVYGQISVTRSAVLKEWTQTGEDETQIDAVAYDEPGAPVHAYRATSAIPWSYQHAWDHALSYKCAIKVIDDNPVCLPEVHEMRADGLTFAPMFTGSDDYPMYSVEYRTRLLGRIVS